MKIKREITKDFLFFVIYKYKRHKINRDMRSVLNVYPGESVDVCFPEGFTVDYETSITVNGKFVEKIETSICTRMHAYYWDEDDHRCLDFYFHNDNIPGNGWFCKMRHLTTESKKKVEEFVKSNYRG